jgi:hypothetical protein
MEPGEALSTAAQVAVALAGFAGVVVVFRTDSVHEWSLMDKFRLRLLLANSMLPLAFCMFALFLLTMNPPPVAIWRWCSGFAAAFLFPFGFHASRVARQIPRAQFHANDGVRFIFYPLYVLGSGVCLLQLYNIAVLNAFWAFFAAIVFQILGAMLQFVRMIFLPRQAG